MDQHIDDSACFLHRLARDMRLADEIPAQEIEHARQLTSTIHLAQGEYLLRAGEIPQRIGFNLAGLLRLYYLDRTGNERNKHFCVERTCAISYSAFLQQTRSLLSIQALEDTTLVIIDHATYHHMLTSHPAWQVAARKFAEMLFILKERREAELLQFSAAERYARFREDYPGLELRVNQYHVASYLGITPESLSRIRRAQTTRRRRG